MSVEYAGVRYFPDRQMNRKYTLYCGNYPLEFISEIIEGPNLNLFTCIPAD
jgi:hypothetical protein